MHSRLRKITSSIMAVVLAVGLLPLPAYGNGLQAGTANLSVFDQSQDAAQTLFDTGEAIAYQDDSGQDAGSQSANGTDAQPPAGSISSQSNAYPDVSGTSALSGRTKSQIKAAWDSIPDQPIGTAIFATQNDTTAYIPAEMTAGAYSYISSYLNFLRYSAGLSSVNLDSTLNANSAQGALILATLDQGLTHYPATPEGITDAQAKAGKYACSTSNLSYSGATYPSMNVLETFLQGLIDDSDAHNRSTVGHRRWFLDPAISTMGAGAAYSYDSPWHNFYGDFRVFTNSSSSYYDASYGSVGRTGDTSYNFVAWPSSGAFANNVFSMGTPWSITLSPAQYKKPDASKVSITVTRVSDGASWTITGADSTPSDSGKYLLVENSGYGVSNCIIFNPGSTNLGTNAYEGLYQVDVNGIETTSGHQTALQYEVDFFDAASYTEPSGGDELGTGTDPEVSTVPIYRFYSYPDTDQGTRMSVRYTSNQALAAQDASRNWIYDGVAWYAPASGSPMYELYNPDFCS